MATGNMTAIFDFFFKEDGTKVAAKAAEYRALTDEDKAQLAEGIANGSMTY